MGAYVSNIPAIYAIEHGEYMMMRTHSLSEPMETQCDCHTACIQLVTCAVEDKHVTLQKDLSLPTSPRVTISSLVYK